MKAFKFIYHGRDSPELQTAIGLGVTHSGREVASIRSIRSQEWHKTTITTRKYCPLWFPQRGTGNYPLDRNNSKLESGANASPNLSGWLDLGPPPPTDARFRINGPETSGVLSTYFKVKRSAMLDKLKSKLRSSKSETQPPIESPLCPPPKYVDDNPMFPTHPSKHKKRRDYGIRTRNGISEMRSNSNENAT